MEPTQNFRLTYLILRDANIKVKDAQILNTMNGIWQSTKKPLVHIHSNVCSNNIRYRSSVT